MPTIPANADPKSQAAAGTGTTAAAGTGTTAAAGTGTTAAAGTGTTAGGAAVPVSLPLSMAKQSYLTTLFF
jgi:hypothetical protein